MARCGGGALDESLLKGVIAPSTRFCDISLWTITDLNRRSRRTTTTQQQKVNGNSQYSEQTEQERPSCKATARR